MSFTSRRQSRTQTVRELTFQQHFCLRNVAAARCQEVTAEIADAPFDIGINDQVFLLFGHETVGLVIHGLDTRIKRFHGLNERHLEVQTRLVNHRAFVAITHDAAELELNPTLAFFHHKDRGIKRDQYDDDDRNN